MRDCEIEREFMEFREEELAEMSKRGDRNARNALYLRKREAVLKMASWAKRYLREAAWAYAEPPLTNEDIEQQTFPVFCDLLDSWQPDSEAFTRLLERRMPGKLVHYVRDTLAPAKRVQHVAPDRMESEPPAQEDTYGEVETQEAWDRYAGVLPAGLWKAVQMRYWHDMSSAQIARKVGRTERTVNRDIAEALNTLKTALTEQREHTA